MIQELAVLAREAGGKVFFHAQMDEGPLSFSYRQTRFAACALARELAKRGVTAGSYVACNLYNSPAFVFLVLAAAYGGFTLAVLNPRLSDEERLLRKVELENAAQRAHTVATRRATQGLQPQLSQPAQPSQLSTHADASPARHTANPTPIEILDEAAVNRLLLEGMGMRVSELGKDDGILEMTPAVMDVLDEATRRERAFDYTCTGIIMFTSGTSGTPKATELTWQALAGSARAANERLAIPGKGIWQMVLPLCHIGGLQVMVRSLLNKNPFILYERYRPSLILNDALTYRVTHISVVDKMLADLLESDHDRIISQYRCILLGGAALNHKTIRKALRAKASVFASYGMTETSSMIACAPITRGFTGELALLPGYEVRTMRADERGIGQLHVKGPGVFKGYLNARASFTADGWFVTGDQARFAHGLLTVSERTTDLIISGGENIYPAEVRDALLKVPGVKDAAVFGTADETWGYRPVAFVEADYSVAALAADHEALGVSAQETGIKPATCPQEFVRAVHDYLEPRMSHLHHPKHIFALPAFPRTAAGKTDMQELRRAYDFRIDIKRVTLHRIRQPFVRSVKTAKATISDRESFFVEVQDWAGRTGIAECVAFETNWYLPETLGDDYEVVKSALASVLLRERYLHPREVARSFATFPALAQYPLAKAAVEPAIWDLYGKIVGKPLAVLLREELVARMGSAEGAHGAPRGLSSSAASSAYSSLPESARSAVATAVAEFSPTLTVPGGPVIGIMSTEDTVAAVDRAVAEGYQRVKIKISPASALEKVEAVRRKHPDLAIFLDANQSFTEEHRDILHKFDALDITCIEEPLDPTYVPAQGRMSLLERLSLLQESLVTPICLDESVVTAQDMQRAMDLPNLRCYALKIAKFGGIGPALDFVSWARDNGVQVWMGGMYDTGVSKRMHAAFEALPPITLTGDLSGYNEYFAEDCALPPLVVEGGKVVLNPPGYEAGLGCELNRAYIKRHLVESVTIGK